MESLFLRSLANGDFVPVALTRQDYGRMAHLVVAYASLPLGTTDAGEIAAAERLKLTEVATLDRHHFSVVRSAAFTSACPPPPECGCGFGG